MTAYDFTVKMRDGTEKSLSDYSGKVLLIVNTATACGFTPQYTELQSIYDEFSKDDFEILDFPCNQFGNQAPGSEEEIADFCELNYGVTFPQFAKIDVNGETAAPLYKWLKNEKRGILGSKSIKWNFTKFLVDRHGRVVKRFAPSDTPKDIEPTIKKIL